MGIREEIYDETKVDSTLLLIISAISDSTGSIALLIDTAVHNATQVRVL